MVTSIRLVLCFLVIFLVSGCGGGGGKGSGTNLTGVVLQGSPVIPEVLLSASSFGSSDFALGVANEPGLPASGDSNSGNSGGQLAAHNPEPATMLLLGGGAVAAELLRRRKKRMVRL